MKRIGRPKYRVLEYGTMVDDQGDAWIIEMRLERPRGPRSNFAQLAAQAVMSRRKRRVLGHGLLTIVAWKKEPI